MEKGEYGLALVPYKRKMSSCLGLYIEEHLIKYAKVIKERDNLKVETFGIKFYDRIGDAIKQVIEETYSQKTPISINLSEEMYNYFNMFALITKNDLQKAIKTEFDAYCTDKGYNPNVFETRYAVVDNQLDKEKLKIIHIADNKIELNKRMQQLSDYKLINISPISMSLPNLIKTKKESGALMVNIEDKTTITTIIDNKVSNIDILEEGSAQILDAINIKENSYSKSYEICKNTTIYTSEGKELQEGEVNYLEDIMPTLYTIVGQVKKIVNANGDQIKTVYLTGTSALINNADLYFQEYLPEVNCEILKPYFVQQTKDISIKDYIEVNTAISLALMGLNEGIAGMNFKAQTFSDKLPGWLKLEVNPDKTKSEQKNIGSWFTWDLNQALDKTEKGLIRIAAYLLVLLIIYSGFSILLNNQMEKKQEEANQSISVTRQQISLAKSDDEKVKSRTNEYTTMIKNLEDANDRITDRTRTRNAIPNLLNQIMSVIPEGVQLTSIDNTSGTHIKITAKSKKYEQLGYFIAKLKTEVILNDVISTAGQKDNGEVAVTIEGELP